MPVRGSERMTWQNDDCSCGLVETEMHVVFECTLYEEERESWRVAVGYRKDGMDEYELIKGYHVRSDEIEKETMIYMRVMWNSRQRHERKNEVMILDTIPIDLACSTLSTLPKAPWQKKMKGTIMLRKCSVCSISIL